MNEQALRIVNAFLKSRTLPDSIQVKYINHKDQKYNTAGDYSESDEKWTSQISIIPEDWRYSFALTMHELAEMGLTKANGVNWKNITQYDTEYPDYDDPGYHKDAPYHKEHMQAEQIEKMIIKFMELDWDKYQKSLDKLHKNYK